MRGRRRATAAAALALAALATTSARADVGSLYRGAAPRPGPDILYAPPASAPQLTNVAPWQAAPILISGASAYRGGEFIYQDFLYDDHGANSGQRDPGDPRAGSDTFSQPNGNYTYPTDPAYAGNAADLVELRVKPLAGATAFRLTLNTLIAPDRIGATIAIGNSSVPLPLPHGANAIAPAKLFLTVHGASADLRDAVTGLPVAGGAPSVTRVDTARRQIEVRVPHAAFDPGRSTVRLAAGVGLWDRAGDRYLVPRQAANATTPGGAGALPAPPAFFNVAFRGAEPLPQITDPAATAASPAWWRDRRQGEALRTGDLSGFHADVDFGKLADRTADESGVPRTGVINRILASRFETKQGIDFSTECGSSAACEGEYRGRLQPYAVYVPAKAPPGGRYGLTLLLHSLGANYNQFSGSRNQSQFGDRGRGHIVITPQGRGPDGWYYDRAGADTFEVWADVARSYALDPALTSIAGYSMGGYGTYKFATQFPDLFARGQPTVGPPGLGIWLPPSPPQPGGDRSLTFRQLASLRNVPFLIWNGSSDQLVPYPGPLRQAQGFDDLAYRYEFDTFTPAEHFTLAINDQFAPAAAFLGDARVDRDPPHVTYVRNPTMDFASAGTTADHAYWLSRIALRDGGGEAPLGTLDARSAGFGVGDPPVSPTSRGSGALTGGSLGAISFTSQSRSWSAAPAAPRADVLRLRARNVGAVTVHPERARITCAARVEIDTDGPIAVTLAGCNRVVGAGGAPSSGGSGACAVASALKRVAAKPRGRGLRIRFARRDGAGRVTVDVFRRSAGRRLLGLRRVARFTGRRHSFTWKARHAKRGYHTIRLRARDASGRTDVRRMVVQRAHQRFRRRAASERRASCATLRGFRLSSPVFGGTQGRALKVRFALGREARVRAALRRGGRVVRRLGATGLRPAGRKTLRVRARGLRRGTYRVRLTVTVPGDKPRRATLTARRL